MCIGGADRKPDPGSIRMWVIGVPDETWGEAVKAVSEEMLNNLPEMKDELRRPMFLILSRKVIAHLSRLNGQ